jgi:hypothetical protein
MRTRAPSLWAATLHAAPVAWQPPLFYAPAALEVNDLQQILVEAAALSTALYARIGGAGLVATSKRLKSPNAAVQYAL